MKIELELTPMQLRLLREIVHHAAHQANMSYHTASQTARFSPRVLEQRRLKMQLTQALFNEMPEPEPLKGLDAPHPNVRQWREGDPIVSERQQHPTR